jgi:hypothetical protein
MQKRAYIHYVMPDLIRHPVVLRLEKELDSGSSPE